MIIETLKEQMDGFSEIFKGRGREGFESYVEGVREELLERRINGVHSGNLNGSLFVDVDGSGGGTSHSNGRRAATCKAGIGIAAELGSGRRRRIERLLRTAAAVASHLLSIDGEVSGQCVHRLGQVLRFGNFNLRDGNENGGKFDWCATS